MEKAMTGPQPGEAVKEWLAKARAFPFQRVFHLVDRMYYELGMSPSVAFRAAIEEVGHCAEEVDFHLSGLALACIRDGLVPLVEEERERG